MQRLSPVREVVPLILGSLKDPAEHGPRGKWKKYVQDQQTRASWPATRITQQRQCKPNACCTADVDVEEPVFLQAHIFDAHHAQTVQDVDMSTSGA